MKHLTDWFWEQSPVDIERLALAIIMLAGSFGVIWLACWLGFCY
jgi:hypothetical protein